MSKEAMKLALEALEKGKYYAKTLMMSQEPFDAAIKALAEQPARPYRLLQDNGSKYFGDSWDKAEQPAQRTWVALTDEEIEKLITDAGFTRSDLLMMGACIDQIARLVEAKLRSKNEDRD